jgi:NAD dependent epimerase/dehydratase family enzyme
MTAPGWTDNRTFTKTLAEILHVPARLSIPEWVMYMRFGNAASTVHKGQAAIPQRLINMGFEHQFNDLKSALKAIVN